jgi:hypothetical protein
MEAIKINPGKGVNNIEFGADEEAVKNLDYPKDILFVEFKNKKAVSVSFRNLPRFYVDEVLVDLENADQWLNKENPYFDGSCYIFPDLKVAAFGLDDLQAGFEITAYAGAVEPLYEKDIQQHARYIDLHQPTPERPAGLEIIPYIQCGQFRFGMSSDEIKKILGAPHNFGTRGNDTLLLHFDNIITRFEKDKLVQVTMENVNDITLKGENISKTGPKANVFAASEKFPNRAYTIFFEYGIAFTGFDKPREAKTIIVFDEPMKSFWSNTKRPLI